MFLAALHVLVTWYHAKAEWKQSQQNSKPHDYLHFFFMMTIQGWVRQHLFVLTWVLCMTESSVTLQ